MAGFEEWDVPTWAEYVRVDYDFAAAFAYGDDADEPYIEAGRLDALDEGKREELEEKFLANGIVVRGDERVRVYVPGPAWGGGA